MHSLGSAALRRTRVLLGPLLLLGAAGAMPLGAQGVGDVQAADTLWLIPLYDSLASEVDSVRARALATTEVRRARRVADERTLDVMLELDPASAGFFLFLDGVQAERRRARETGNVTRVRELDRQATQARLEIERLRQRALEDSAVARADRHYRRELEQTMQRLEPGLAALRRQVEQARRRLARAYGAALEQQGASEE